MNDGVLLLDKPVGPTSHDVVNTVRRALDVKRVGHTGTLDPFASGLLVMLVGRATRLAQFMTDLPKTYLGVMRLGIETDSWDRTGTVEHRSVAWREISDQRISAALQDMVGVQQQQPPPLSAKKLGGVPAHRRVRRGESVELARTTVTVAAVDVIRRQDDLVTFRVTVGSGTYIRWIAHEVGTRLGCGAHLHTLRREAIGRFRVEDAVVPEAISSDHLETPYSAVAHLPTIHVGSDEAAAVQHGRSIGRPEAVRGGAVALLAADRLVAVARCVDDRLKPQVVLA